MQGLYKVERERAFDADGFYHTGDAGYFDGNGHLFFEGRLGDLIKTGGANVSPREVEVVLESVPGIKEAYIVGIPDPERGQNVAAAIVLQSDCALTPQRIIEAARRELSAYKVPRHLFVYDRAALPFTDTGKIDKRRLQAMVAERIANTD